MGNTISASFLRASLPTKRKTVSTDYDSDGEVDFSDDMHTPKRRKVMSTSKYIYKALFEGGQGSDVKIVALNKEWDLHRIYLSQSPYFNSMFNGTWLETKQREISIGIEDINITSGALHKVFGSLYQDEIGIEPSEAVAVLSCATLLQLDDLIHQSVEVMKDSINMGTVLQYYDAADLYGLKDIKAICIEWLYKNIAIKLSESPEYLRQISCELMTTLVSSPHLIVVQTEFSLYLILKQWLFLLENPSWTGNHDECMGASQVFFHDYSGTASYLMTSGGEQYQPAFRALRLKHLVVHHVDMEVIEMDHIIPVEWFTPIFKLQWYQMLRVEQGVDRGPKAVTEDDFEKQCVRCGRLLLANAQHSWRWTGFNFGFDLVVYYINGSFKLRRFLKADNLGMSKQLQRHLMYRLAIYALDKNGRVTHKAETKIQTASLTENEQVTVLNVRSDIPFPLLLSANFLLTTPLCSTDVIAPGSLATTYTNDHFV